MEMTYRLATEKDIPLIAQLAHKIWKAHYPAIIGMEQVNYMLNKMYTEESLLQQMKEGQKFTLAYLGDQPIGYISFSSKDQREFMLHKFYIDTSLHGKNIGTKMFNYMLEQLQNAEKIRLTVNRQNFKAINFYFKNGFVIEEVADFDIGDGYFMNDFVMVKKVNALV